MRLYNVLHVAAIAVALWAAPAPAQQVPKEPPPASPAATPPPASPAKPDQAPPMPPVEPVQGVEPAGPVEPQPPVPAPPKRKGPVDSLKPGQFVWEKRDSYANQLRMVAVLDIQRLYVFDGDDLVGFSTISTGKKGKETPTGAFTILQKKVYHESNLYSNAPMPFMQRLTWDGIAMHAGHNPGYPASHGCIRLPKRFAEALFNATEMGAEVVVLASLSQPRAKPAPVPSVVEPGPPVPPQPIPQSVPQSVPPAQPSDPSAPPKPQRR